MRLATSDLRERVIEITEHNRALDRVTQANEARFAEVLEAKAEVEQKVLERTAELRATGEKLADALAQVQALDRAKTNFFNNVSHDLRSPLTLILGPLRDMVDGREPPGGRSQALETMARNAERLLRLINQILDLAKIDTGDVQLRREQVEPAKLVRAAVSGFETAARQAGVTLAAEISQAPSRATWDPAWIESAVNNLLANALQHVTRGGHVTVSIVDRGVDIALEVTDDGAGIREEDLPHIFERFAQGGDTHSGRGGTGLGLAIVREAARLHGGDASVRSKVGEGTTFTVILPRTYDAPPAEHPPAPDEPAERAPTHVLPRALEVEPEPLQSSWRPGPSPRAPLALVVEDNTDLRRYMAEVLGAQYRVQTADNGIKALELMAETPPDVVVSDVAMPGMDGYELCRRIRAVDGSQATPIILVTAAGDLARVLEGFDAGANDYVTKPFHARELLARVDVHLKLRALIREVARRERLAMLGTVAASVAHQVRNPLTTLVSGLPAMRRRVADRLDPASLEMLDAMLDCAERIQHTTNDLLDLSRIDRAEVADFRPGPGLSAALRLAQTRLVSSDVVLDIQVDEQIELRGRAGDLNQVFLNLLDNAAREVAYGGSIRVRGEREGNDYVVRIEDSGRGVDEATAELVFQAFWTSRPPGEGTGLGLSVAKSVVEQHGGTIEVDRSDLGGARFTIRLPLPRSSPSQPAARL